MALATRPKPKVQHRKRQALHHHQGKSYLKTYWPYLPMFAVVGAGVLANRSLDQSNGLGSSPGTAVSSQHVVALQSSSRIQNLVGTQSDWILIAALLVTAAALTFFVVSHWYRLQRLISRGESYIIHHPLLEIGTVVLITVGFVLTRSAGLPH